MIYGYRATVYRANGEKRCVAKTIANTNEFIYSHLHLIITYNDSSEWDTYRDAIGKGSVAERTTSYEMDIDCLIQSIGFRTQGSRLEIIVG